MSAAGFADLLVLAEDPGRISAVAEARQLERFVPGTFRQDNWAMRELHRMRIRPSQRHGGIEVMSMDAGARVFSDNWSSEDLSDDAGDTDMDLQVSLDGAEGQSWLFGPDSDLGAAILSTGLGMDGLATDLPPLAIQGGYLITMVNKGALSLALMMRRIFGLDSAFRAPQSLGDRVDSSKLKDPEKKKKGKNRRNETVAQPDEPEPTTVTMRQVVRSAVKICLGLLLGVLLFTAVRRS